MQAKTVRIPTRDGEYTELTRSELQKLVETLTPNEFRTKLNVYDNLGIDLLLQNEFGKSYAQIQIDYIKSLPNLESAIIEMTSPQDFMDQYHIHEDLLNAVLKEKFGGTFVEVKVLGKFRRSGIKEQEIKAVVVASSSQQALADQIKESRHNLIQFFRIRFRANYYEVKHEGATSRQIIEFYCNLWDKEGYESLPRSFLQDYLGKNWKKKLQNKDAGRNPDAVLVPARQEITDMSPEEVTSDDLIKLIPSKTIEQLRRMLKQPNVSETLSHIKKKVDKPYGYIVLDSFATRESFLQRIDAADSIEKFYQALFLTEAEFAKYIRQRFFTKLSDQNQVVFRFNYQVPLEVLMEAVRNDGVVKKPKRQIETIDKAELRQKIIDAKTMDDLLEEFDITVSILHRVIGERFEDETYLEIKLSGRFKSKADLRAAVDRTEKFSDLANELGVGLVPLALYIKKRLGENFSTIKLNALSDDQLKELFSKSNTRAKMYNFLKISCGANRDEAENFLTNKYGDNWEFNLSSSAPQSVKKQVRKKRQATDDPRKITTTTPEPPAAAGHPIFPSKFPKKNPSIWQSISHSIREKVPALDPDEEDVKYEDDPVWGDIVNSNMNF